MYQSKAAIVVFVLMLVFAGQATADFKGCFGICVIGCAFESDKFICGANCLAKCILNKDFEANFDASSKVYCNYGCAVDQCAKFGDGMYLIASCTFICSCYFPSLNYNNFFCHFSVSKKLVYFHFIFISA